MAKTTKTHVVINQHYSSPIMEWLLTLLANIRHIKMDEEYSAETISWLIEYVIRVITWSSVKVS